MHATLMKNIVGFYIVLYFYIMNRAYILKVKDSKPQNDNYKDIKTMAYKSIFHPQQRRYTQN